MSNIIELDGICRSFYAGNNEIRALNGVNLQVCKGDLLAITGASGSGKTTLMNILGLLDTPTSGSYLLNNESVEKFSEKQRAISRNKTFGFVVQDFALVEMYTVRENVNIPFTYSNIKHSKEDRKKIVDSLLHQLGIFDKQDIQVRHLSGGERQRTAIARALVCDPDILLADEPTGALDSKTSEEIMDIFINLHSKGKTVIIITHNENIAQLCNRRIQISDGKLISDTAII